MLMYREFYGIRGRPFPITPDPRFLYLSSGHQEALAHLLYALVDGGGFVLLTGEVGTGKTSICRYALEQMPSNVDVALIVNPDLSKFELVASLCDEFGVPGAKQVASHKEALDLLYEYLIDANARARHSIVMIDEAQNLRPEVLEQLRLLTNLETDTRKLLQIILVGQPELNVILGRHELRQLNQRIGSRYHLCPLSREETAAYVRHRLAVAGATREIFTPQALSEVYRHSRGVPRVINILCDRCLLGGYAEASASVSKTIVRRAALEVSPWPRSFPGLPILARIFGAKGARVMSILGLMVLLGGFFVTSGIPPFDAAQQTAASSGRQEGRSHDPVILDPSDVGAPVLALGHLAADIDIPVSLGVNIGAPVIDCEDQGVAIGRDSPASVTSASPDIGGSARYADAFGAGRNACSRVNLAEFPRK